MGNVTSKRPFQAYFAAGNAPRGYVTLAGCHVQDDGSAVLWVTTPVSR